MFLSLRWSSHHLAFRRFCCESSAPDMARYREAFAKRMTMAGVKPQHRIALGVSGGPDSMALCVLAAGWKSDGLIAKNEASGCIDGLLGIIVDHKLRTGSTEEASEVRARVSKMGIECEIACCDWLGGRPKQGHIQEAAREKRYQIFQGVCIEQQIGVLLIAHHADDQVELFILRLSRKSGVLGLAGMPFVSQLFPTRLNNCGECSVNRGIVLLRPMLEFSKDDMYQICREENHEWVEDPTNKSQLFVRNRIRTSLKNFSSCIFGSEMQKLIATCRLTRFYVESTCHKLIKHFVTIMDHGYAIIDLKNLAPSNVEDICLSKFLASILQFISQRHRPIRGSVSQLLLEYARKIPCKTSLTAAGCYLCAAPGSKGTKILVCCSLDLPHSSKAFLPYSYFCEESPPLSEEIDQIIMDAKTYSGQLVSRSSGVHFLNVESSEAILDEAKKLDIISESTLERILLLQKEESFNFTAKIESDLYRESRHEVRLSNFPSTTLRPGELFHFMSRFIVRWEIDEDCSSSVNDVNQNSEENQDHLCRFCRIDQERIVAIRHMEDADWLYLAEISKASRLINCEGDTDLPIKLEKNVAREVQCFSCMQLSARRALQALKSIPVYARKGLPVLVDSQGLLLSIPNIYFRCCPRLLSTAVFKPRVPLGGGYNSYM